MFILLIFVLVVAEVLIGTFFISNHGHKINHLSIIPKEFIQLAKIQYHGFREKHLTSSSIDGDTANTIL